MGFQHPRLLDSACTLHTGFSLIDPYPPTTTLLLPLQKKKIKEEDKTDIDNKKKALFKLLIDAKKNTDINIEQTELTDESYNIEKEDTETMNLIINNKNR